MMLKSQNRFYSALVYLKESKSSRGSAKNFIEEDVPIYDVVGSGKRRKIRGYIWGGGQYGALGSQNILRPKNNAAPKLYIKAPMQMHFTKKFEITKVECGYGFTIFASNSSVYGCGLNNHSQIGYHEARKNSGESLGFVLEPLPIKIPYKSKNSQILKIAAGLNHSAILTTEGVYTLGSNDFGQCGRKVITDENYKNNQTIHFLSQSDLPPILDVVCNENSTYLLTQSGSIHAFGQGTYGQIGDGKFNEINYEPTQVDTQSFCGIKHGSDEDHIIKLSSRSSTILALTKKGRLLGWGSGEHGQFDGQQSSSGHQSMKDGCSFGTPIPLDDLICPKGIIPIDIACTHTACAVVDKKTGSVWVWGMGILGKGPILKNSTLPTLIPRSIFNPNKSTNQTFNTSPQSTVLKIFAGYSHFAALTSTGSLFTWGNNRSGCLGLGHTESQYFPYPLVLMCSEVSHVSLGYDHTAIIVKTLV